MASPGTTPGRTTQVYFDVPIWVIQEEGLCDGFPMEKLSKGRNDNTNTLFTPGYGWHLKSFEQDVSQAHELGIADAAALTPSNGNATVAPGFKEIPVKRAYTEVVPQGSQRNGDTYLTKAASNTADWTTDFKLTADQTSFPGPAGTPIVPLDRVFITTENITPIQFFHVKLRRPDFGLSALDEVARVTFSNIPGQTTLDQIAGEWGTGRYCLRVFGTGKAILTELTNTGIWGERQTFAVGGVLNAGELNIRIISDAWMDPQGHWHGTKIGFVFQHEQEQGASSAGVGSFLLKQGGIPATSSSVNWYFIPQVTQRAPNITPVRVDIRQDVKPTFQVRKSFFFEQGTVRTVTSTLKQAPYDLTVPLQAKIFGYAPASLVTIQVFSAADNTPLVPTGAIIQSPTGCIQSFTPIKGQSQYYTILTLNASSDKLVSPVVKDYQLVRDPVNRKTAATPFSPQIVESVSITSADGDPSHETCRLRVWDLNSSLTALKVRSRMPIRIEAQYDPNDPTKTTVLFIGYVVKARRIKKGTKKSNGVMDIGGERVYPDSEWCGYDITCMGEWMRLAQKLTLHGIGTLNLNFDPLQAIAGTPSPMKVTDIIVKLLGAIGYPPSMIDVVANNIRFFAEGNEPFYLAIFSQIDKTLLHLIRDYLGGIIKFNKNATNKLAPGGFDPNDKFGCWQVRIPGIPDAAHGKYVNMWAFNSDSKVVQTQVWGVSPAAFPDVPAGAQTIKSTFIRRGTISCDVEMPGHNQIIVTGVGIQPGTALQPDSGPVGLTQTLSNWVSAEFIPGQGTGSDTHPAPDPTSPDYLGDIVPLYYPRTELNSVAAVNLVLLRLADIEFHAKAWTEWESPVLLGWDSTDPNQIRPRMPDYGDGCLVDGVQNFINSCNPAWEFRKGGTRYQHAGYEAFNVPSLLAVKNPAIAFTDVR